MATEREKVHIITSSTSIYGLAELLSAQTLMPIIWSRAELGECGLKTRVEPRVVQTTKWIQKPKRRELVDVGIELWRSCFCRIRLLHAKSQPLNCPVYHIRLIIYFPHLLRTICFSIECSEHTSFVTSSFVSRSNTTNLPPSFGANSKVMNGLSELLSMSSPRC